MQVKDIMSRDVASCALDADLASVARIMWEKDCGFVPIVDGAGHLCGVITDRDICIAASTRGLAPQQMVAGEAMHHGPIYTVHANEPVAAVLGLMRDAQIHRLPVVTLDGALAGIVSMNDIVLAAEERHMPPARDVLAVLAAIAAHRDALVAA